ncbi:MAG: hypothetical protein DRH37_04565 [Deltaproteobacteria bacterium]|nr:MAG: hypothetical protein DRH37_04565 [Deltaproteobacteria bacterium]
MGFTVEQECPQCGGPVELDEGHRLLRCPYCSVNIFLFAPNHFRFVLPHKVPDREIVYMPYFRFMGSAFFCGDLRVSHRFLDITHAGIALNGIPSSLGLRPQAMKMKFVSPDTQGKFLQSPPEPHDILEKATRPVSAGSGTRVYHKAYIGETVSLIYLPLFIRENRVFDAVLNRHLFDLPPGRDLPGTDKLSRSEWKLTFLPTLCPQCGWDLEGDRDSVVLTCSNCDSAWEASDEKFNKTDLWTARGQDKQTVYLPFWRISASAEDLGINSFADFIRIINQPVAIKKEWENREMDFWIPAFKIRPKIFLRLSGQVTVRQHVFLPEKRIPKKNQHPVTLPRAEAVQAMKITLADVSMNKRKILPLLPEVAFDIKGYALVYLPFSDTGPDMTLNDTRISINKQALKFGRKL